MKFVLPQAGGMEQNMLNDITLQQIEIFLTVSEQLSLSEAAKDLFLNQSAVSRWISRLEKSLNMQLFSRTNRGVELTENGEFLYEELKPVFEKLRNSLQSIREMYDMSDSIFTIGCLDNPEVIDALRLAADEFGVANADKLLRIQLLDFKDLREALVCGNLDCIVVYSIGFGEYRNVSTKKIKKLDTYLAVSRKGTLAESESFPPAESLANETLYLISTAEMKDAENRAIATCESLGFTPKGIKYMPSYFAMELAVKNNRGFTLAGTNICARFKDDIKLYPIPNPPQNQYVVLAWHEMSCSESTKRFIETVPEVE